jgi:mono/diheme cytochrome c family protein
MRRIAVTVSLLSAALAFAAAPPSSKELLEKGKASFNINCVACHGPKGAGDGAAAVALNPKPRNYATDTFKNGDKVEDVFKTLATGVKDSAMVSFAHLPEQDRWALAYYVLELRAAGKASAVVDAGTAAAPDAGKAKTAKPKK